MDLKRVLRGTVFHVIELGSCATVDRQRRTEGVLVTAERDLVTRILPKEWPIVDL